MGPKLHLSETRSNRWQRSLRLLPRILLRVKYSKAVIFGAKIEKLNNKIPANVQNQVLFPSSPFFMVRRATRWFLRHRNPAFTSIQEHIDFYKKAFNDLNKNALDYMNDAERKVIVARIDELVEQGAYRLN